MKKTLSSGAWVEYKPLDALRAADKDALTIVVRMSAPAGEDGTVDLSSPRARIGAEMAIRDAVWAVCLTGWSFDAPPPAWDEDAYAVTGTEAIRDMGLADYAEIEELLTPHAELLLRRPDPKGSTTSSSNGPSPASAARASRTGSARRTTGTSST